jgi:rubredoxin
MGAASVPRIQYLESSMKRYVCLVCGLIYDETQGWPEDGIPAGTAWEDVPADWKCPECGAGKVDFELIDD